MSIRCTKVVGATIPSGDVIGKMTNDRRMIIQMRSIGDSHMAKHRHGHEECAGAEYDEQ